MKELALAEQLFRVVSGPLETLMLERLPDGGFRRFGESPPWARLLAGSTIGDPTTVFPFLQSFLDEAAGVWAGHRDDCLRSGFWAQRGPDAHPLHLSALAVRSGELKLLLIAHDEDTYRDQQLLAQKGRESTLALERLGKEIQRKEILVHCIVHDLAVPINALTGTLGLLEEARGRLPVDLARLVHAASRAADRQAALVREILDAFAAEQEELAHVERTAERAPDVRVAVEGAIELLEPQARAQEITVRLDRSPDCDWRVVGEASRLERIFINLLENALRFSPPGGVIAIRLSCDEDGVVATVDDEGPGIPEELRPHLFQRFVQGRGRTGRLGLGLYFCAIMMRRWGGNITSSTAPSGGARFEMRFSKPLVDRPAEQGPGDALVDSLQ